MKILIHSNGPMVPTGYGNQTRLLMPRLRELGHEVAVSAFSGLSGSPITWDGFTIYPAGTQDFGPDVICGHALDFGADLVITLMDAWKLAPAAAELSRAPFKLAMWLPIDTTPLSKLDAQILAATRAQPIAMSQFGLAQLAAAGWPDALYAPHMVDCSHEFRPQDDREAFREQIGLAGKFTIGICAANKDVLRKGWPEQFRAFARFHKKHSNSLLLVHTVVGSPGGFDLAQLAADMGIIDATMFTEQYPQVAGLMPPQMMSDWFGSLDVLSSCSYAEAFGVPIIEAQATGTPAIVTDGSAMAELSALKVPGQEFWNPVHRAFWVRPDVGKIAGMYEKEYLRSRGPSAADRRVLVRQLVTRRFNADQVATEYWKPALEQLEAE